ncbi:MAG TPA: hypothetical protein VE957_18465 [Terriglobales bacterium]|nr:hypothetical protein [Terriglobales bacterium]
MINVELNGGRCACEHMKYSPEGAAEILKVKPDVIRRAINLGAIVLGADGLISHEELSGFVVKGFKQHRYDAAGNKLPGAKS